jgi:hypothetical protein
MLQPHWVCAPKFTTIAVVVGVLFVIDRNKLILYSPQFVVIIITHVVPCPTEIVGTTGAVAAPCATLTSIRLFTTGELLRAIV